MSSQWPLIATRKAAACNNQPACQSTISQSSIGDFFGYAVDISGTTALVGAFMQRSGRGDAYIFERNFDGTAVSVDTMWQLAKRLTAPDDAAGLSFGFSVSLEGSFALVTALKDNDGRGYLFGRNYGGLNNWGFVQKLSQPAVGSSSMQYASNVGLPHVWNHWSDGGGSYANGAHLLHTAPYYNATPMLQAAATSSPVFGASARISGSTIAIGAPYADSVGNADVGAVSLTSLRPVHRMSPAEFDETTIVGLQIAQGDEYGARSSRDHHPRLGPSRAEPRDSFELCPLPPPGPSSSVVCAGAAVHLTANGKYAVVGAPNAGTATATRAGAAYVLAKSRSGAWAQSSTPLVAADAADGDNFGEEGRTAERAVPLP
jgi:hypothetical protein